MKNKKFIVILTTMLLITSFIKTYAMDRQFFLSKKFPVTTEQQKSSKNKNNININNIEINKTIENLRKYLTEIEKTPITKILNNVS